MTETALPAPRPRGEFRAFLFLAGLGFLEMILFVTGLAMGAQGGEVAVLLLALVTLLVAAGPILLDLSRPPERRQLLITLLVLVYVLFLVIPVFTQYFLMKGDLGGGPFSLAKRTPWEIARAQMVALLGLGALLLGFYLPLGRIVAAQLPRPTREWPPHAALAVGLLTLFIGWIVYFLGQVGMLPSNVGNGALGAIASGSFLGICVLALTWLRYRRPEALLLIAIVVPLAMFFNFFTGSKTKFLTPPFMIVLAYIVYERRVRMSWVAVGFAALVILYPASQFYRSAVQLDKTRGGIQNFLRDPDRALRALSTFGSELQVGEYVTQGLEATGSRLNALGALTMIVRDTPDRVPYQGGWTIAYIAVAYVPRVVWPGKPATTIGEWVCQTYGNAQDLVTDVGPTWIGEFYLNFGYVGVALGMFVLGFLCRLLQQSLFVWNAPIPAMFGAVIALYFVSRNVQSGLVSAINGTTFHLAPLLFAHLFVGIISGYTSVGRSEQEDRGDIHAGHASPVATSAP